MLDEVVNVFYGRGNETEIKTMVFDFQEHSDYEANARYDYVSEAYAATRLDPYEEGYCNYVFDAEESGEPVVDFAVWKASKTTRATSFHAAPRGWTEANDDFPFLGD